MNHISKLLEVMAALRDDNTGCPWDRQQDFATIAPYTIEEAYEVADAIHRHDIDGLRDELGDLLFQIVFHARIAEEQNVFDFADVAAGITQKMIRRHPHVFGSKAERDAGAQPGSWEQIKAAERQTSNAAGDQSALAGVAAALPALKRAQKLGERAAAVGFDWPDTAGVRRKIDEEMSELSAAECSGMQGAMEEELGDLLFSVVNLARHLAVDAEQALAGAGRKFEQRFRKLEALTVAEGNELASLGLDELEARWQIVKDSADG